MGNCLDRSLSDEGEADDLIENASNDESRSRINRNSRSHNYSRILDHSSSSSLVSLTNCTTNQTNHTQSAPQRILNHSTSSIHDPSSFFTRRSSYTNSTSLPISLQMPISLNPNASISSSSSSLPPNNNNSTTPQQQQQQVFYLAPNIQRTADQLTEEEQIKLLKRMTLIQQLPSGSYDESKKNKECVICMIDFEINDTIKYLPCMHTFHQSCIDAWLVRSLICPSCMEPVDAGLLSAFENE